MADYLSRRSFLAASSVASATALARLQLALAAGTKDGWGEFPVGVQTISLRKYALPEVMRHLQGMGVRHVELSASNHLNAKATDEQIATARQLAARPGALR
jgi:hypothetical protein